MGAKIRTAFVAPTSRLAWNVDACDPTLHILVECKDDNKGGQDPPAVSSHKPTKKNAEADRRHTRTKYNFSSSSYATVKDPNLLNKP